MTDSCREMKRASCELGWDLGAGGVVGGEGGAPQTMYQEARKSSRRMGAAQKKSCMGRVAVMGWWASGWVRTGRRKMRPLRRQTAAARARRARERKRRSCQWRPGTKKALRATQ